MDITVLALLPLIFYVAALADNPSRALLPFEAGDPELFNTSREELLFINSPEIMDGYMSITRAVLDTNCREIGLHIDSNQIEYPFWVLLAEKGQPFYLEHLDVEPPLSQYTSPDFHPCAVICTVCSDDTYRDLLVDSTHYGDFYLYLREDEATGKIWR